MKAIPEELAVGPFTAEHAAEFGVTQRMLAERRFRQVFPRVYAVAGQPETVRLLAGAALLIAPPDSIITGTTALQMYDIDVGQPRPVHLVTTHRHPVRRRDIKVSRVQVLPPDRDRVCLPAHALLHSCRDLDLLDAVIAGDGLTRRNATQPSLLRSLAAEVRGLGSRQMRRAASWFGKASIRPARRRFGCAWCWRVSRNRRRTPRSDAMGPANAIWCIASSS